MFAASIFWTAWSGKVVRIFVPAEVEAIRLLVFRSIWSGKLLSAPILFLAITNFPPSVETLMPSLDSLSSILNNSCSGTPSPSSVSALIITLPSLVSYLTLIPPE